MYQLAIFDVDGTMVSHGDRVLLDSTVEAINTLKAKGIKIAIASGRPYFMIEKSIMTRIKFDYFVCCNGLYVCDKDGKIVYSQRITADTITKLVSLFKKNNDAISFQFEDGTYVYNGYEKIVALFNANLGRNEFVHNDINNTRHLVDLPFSGVVNIAKEHIEEYKMEFPEFRFERFKLDYHDLYFKKYCKATGIAHLCESIGINLQDVIAFGDGINDVDMLKECGCGVCMGDGIEVAKEAADYVTLPTKEGGIYAACKHLGLL